MCEQILSLEENRFLAIAVYSAFFVVGLRDTEPAGRMGATSRGRGDVRSDIVRFAPYLFRLETAAVASLAGPDHHHGVFEQDVCRLFGRWVGEAINEAGEMPVVQECEDWLVQRVLAYFSPSLGAEDARNLGRALGSINVALNESDELTRHLADWNVLQRAPCE